MKSSFLYHVLCGGNVLSSGFLSVMSYSLKASERGVMRPEVKVNWAIFFPEPNSADPLCIISSLRMVRGADGFMTMASMPSQPGCF